MKKKICMFVCSLVFLIFTSLLIGNAAGEAQYTLVLDYWTGDSFAQEDGLYNLNPPYTLSATWHMNEELSAGKGFNIFLIKATDDNISPDSTVLKLNDNYVTETTYSFSSAVIQTMCDICDMENIDVRLRVDLVDISTGKAEASAISLKACKIHKASHDNSHDEALSYRMDNALMYHDSIYRGYYYEYGKKINGNNAWTIGTIISKIYTIGVGDIHNLRELPTTRAVLLASAILNDISKTKAHKSIPLSEIKDVLGIIGFDADVLLEKLSSEKEAIFAYWESVNNGSQVILTDDLDINFLAQKIGEKAAALSQAEGIKDSIKVVKEIIDIAKAVQGIIVDYCSFYSITYDDVEKYITTFNAAYKATGDIALYNAAEFLQEITESHVSLAANLAASYGFDLGKKYFAKTIFKMSATSIHPLYGLMTDGIKIVADATLNTTSVFVAGYQLEAMAIMTDSMRDYFKQAYEEFISDPVNNYDRFVVIKDIYFEMLKYELEMYDKVTIELNNGIIENIIMMIPDPFNEKDNLLRPGKLVPEIKTYFDAELQSYYKRYIAPYRPSEIEKPATEDLPVPAEEDEQSGIIGREIKFGCYEQDNNPENGREPIEWIVLDEKDGKALLLSKYGLDTALYHNKWENITWEQCSLRSWLNGDFYENSFSIQEQLRILQTDVENSKEQGYKGFGMKGGKDTRDYVFLLSYRETFRTYLESNDARICPITDYVADSLGYESGNDYGGGTWWLRSPGDSQDWVACVDYEGNLSSCSELDVNILIRPALWISLEEP